MDDKDISKERLQPIPAAETMAESAPETKEIIEKGEASAEELAKLQEDVEGLDLADDVKKQANVTAQSIQSLTAQKKIEELLAMAKDKGVVYAIHVAKGMDDPYILDTLHDVLAKDGQYKKFLK